MQNSIPAYQVKQFFSTGRELLASMRFAIALLVVICIASVIGTIVQQQEPYSNYVNQFGPFWAQVFDTFGLYNIYSTWWFVLILTFLVLSTSLCITRNTPKIIKDVKNFKENLHLVAFEAFHYRNKWYKDENPKDILAWYKAKLGELGWRVKTSKKTSHGYTLAARKGRVNKAGYLAAHSAIVLICIGGLLDSSLPIRLQAWFTDKAPYTGGGLIADVAPQHWLSTNNPTFRGNIFVSEGTRSDVAILNQSQGVFIQPLPFSIGLEKFIVEYHSNGMPKLFASDIVLRDKDTQEEVSTRIEVNHPFKWRGISIYQSSFEDGGSAVTLRTVPLKTDIQPFTVQGVIGGNAPINIGTNTPELEFTDLRVFNVEDLTTPEINKDIAVGTREHVLGVVKQIEGRLGAANKTQKEKVLRNVGPSVSYKLRDISGQAIEYNNYMLPIDFNDGNLPVFLLGVREDVNADFRYLRIPADENAEMQGFLRLRQALQDPSLIQKAIHAYLREQDSDTIDVAVLKTTSERAMQIFAGQSGIKDNIGAPLQGLPALGTFLEQEVPESERERVGNIVLQLVTNILFQMHNITREKEGLTPLTPDTESRAFISQSIVGLSDLAFYPSPVTFMLDDFEQVQASVFQVTRSPGQPLVYLGALFLILGIFAMLYIRDRRLWIWIQTPTEEDKKGTVLYMAYSSNRKIMDNDREFNYLKKELR